MYEVKSYRDPANVLESTILHNMYNTSFIPRAENHKYLEKKIHDTQNDRRLIPKGKVNS